MLIQISQSAEKIFTFIFHLTAWAFVEHVHASLPQFCGFHDHFTPRSWMVSIRNLGLLVICNAAAARCHDKREQLPNNLACTHHTYYAHSHVMCHGMWTRLGCQKSGLARTVLAGPVPPPLSQHYSLLPLHATLAQSIDLIIIGVCCNVL